MFLYHISFQSLLQSLTPRIPKERAPGEDAKTPRICLCTSIARAVSAMPAGGMAMRGMLRHKNQYTPVLHVYACLHRGPGFIAPDMVRRLYGVSDAESTDEWWAIRPLQFLHRIALIHSADTRDWTDPFGHHAIQVDTIDFDFVDTPPAGTLEDHLRRTGNNHIQVRDAYAYIARQERSRSWSM